MTYNANGVLWFRKVELNIAIVIDASEFLPTTTAFSVGIHRKRRENRIV
jgi:hypothetical protein